MIRSICVAACLLISTPVCAQEVADHTAQATPNEIKAEVSAMLASMKPGQTFLWRPLLKAGPQIAALEVWRAPGRPAIHSSEGEYITVVQGRGTLVTGGTLVAPRQVSPGFIDGEVIEGGTTRSLAPGDFALIPAGVPHWFGIPGEPLVLLGIKVPTSEAR